MLLLFPSLKRRKKRGREDYGAENTEISLIFVDLEICFFSGQLNIGLSTGVTLILGESPRVAKLRRISVSAVLMSEVGTSKLS